MIQLFQLNTHIRGNYAVTDGAMCCTATNALVPLEPFIRGDDYVTPRFGFYHAYYQMGAPFSVSRASYNCLRNYQRFFEYVGNGNHPVNLMKKIRGSEEMKYYIAAPNSIFDDNYKPLLIVAAYNKTIDKLQSFFDRDYEEIDKKLICVVVSTAIYSEENKDFYRNLNKYYLEECRRQGIDIMETSDINKYCFDPATIRVPNFETLEEEEQYLQSVTSLLYENPPQQREPNHTRSWQALEIDSTGINPDSPF